MFGLSRQSEDILEGLRDPFQTRPEVKELLIQLASSNGVHEAVSVLRSGDNENLADWIEYLSCSAAKLIGA